MLRLNVADGVHALTRAWVNCYLIEDDDGVTIVDAGLPRMWVAINQALEEIGRSPSDVKALILTHGHFDHVGFAARLQRDWNVPVFIHQADASLAAHPYSYTPQRNRFVYPLVHPTFAADYRQYGIRRSAACQGRFSNHRIWLR